MIDTIQEILRFITYGVITVVGLLLIIVLIRLFEVLGHFRNVLRRIIAHRGTMTDTLRQIRLFCQKYTQDPED